MTNNNKEFVMFAEVIESLEGYQAELQQQIAVLEQQLIPISEALDSYEHGEVDDEPFEAYEEHVIIQEKLEDLQEKVYHTKRSLAMLRDVANRNITGEQPAEIVRIMSSYIYD
jgi:hypothetical protein